MQIRFSIHPLLLDSRELKPPLTMGDAFEKQKLIFPKLKHAHQMKCTVHSVHMLDLLF